MCLFKFRNAFVQNGKCVCPNKKNAGFVGLLSALDDMPIFAPIAHPPISSNPPTSTILDQDPHVTDEPSIQYY